MYTVLQNAKTNPRYPLHTVVFESENVANTCTVVHVPP